MLDLDKYINNSTEIKIGGEIIHVKQPTVAMIDKIDVLEKDITEENVRAKRIETVSLLLNHNEENKKFAIKDLLNWTNEALMKVIATMSLLRYETETDPN